MYYDCFLSNLYPMYQKYVQQPVSSFQSDSRPKNYGDRIQTEKIILCDVNPSKQDTILAELLQIHKEHIVGYHEHDSLLDHKEEEELTEEERKAAWAEYEAEKKVVHSKCFLVFVFVLVI